MKTIHVTGSVIHNGQQVRGKDLVVDDTRSGEPGCASVADAQRLIDLGQASETGSKGAAPTKGNAPTKGTSKRKGKVGEPEAPEPLDEDA